MSDAKARDGNDGDDSSNPSPSSNPAEDGDGGMANSSPAIAPHVQILDELEAKARRLCGGGTDIVNDGNIIREQGDQKGEEWTLADDARLASFVQEFTAHIQRRAESIADAVVSLENKKDRAAAKVELAKSALLALPDQRFVQQVVVDGTGDDAGDDNVESQQHEDKVDDNENNTGTADEEQDPTKLQQDLEDQAIRDGMKGLKLFYDPAHATGTEDHYFGLDQGDDSACYYESAPADAFNQRPLPFVVGSREFMESKDAGLGEEYGTEDAEEGSEALIAGLDGSFLLDKSPE